MKTPELEDWEIPFGLSPKQINRDIRYPSIAERAALRKRMCQQSSDMLLLRDLGHTPKEIAELLKLSDSKVRYWLKRPARLEKDRRMLDFERYLEIRRDARPNNIQYRWDGVTVPNP